MYSAPVYCYLGRAWGFNGAFQDCWLQAYIGEVYFYEKEEFEAADLRGWFCVPYRNCFVSCQKYSVLVGWCRIPNTTGLSIFAVDIKLLRRL